MKMTGIYTTAGAQLAARVQAEGLNLQITRAAAGSNQTSNTATQLTRERQALTISGKTAQDGVCTITALLNAANTTVVYSLQEVGLFARVGEEEEVLYKLFRLSETLTVEPGVDMILTFYLTETILQEDEVEVVVSQQGLVTQEICTQTAQAAVERVRSELTVHAADASAHSALFAQKAPLSHTHGAAQITAGALGGVVAAQSNAAYTTAQLRNIVLSAGEPSGGSNGQVWIQYRS